MPTRTVGWELIDLRMNTLRVFVWLAFAPPRNQAARKASSEYSGPAVFWKRLGQREYCETLPDERLAA